MNIQTIYDYAKLSTLSYVDLSGYAKTDGMRGTRGLSAGPRLSLIVLSAMAVAGCALGGNSERMLTQKEASDSTAPSVESATPPGYPYPPQELWRRLVEVIKTHPDELTHPKLGQILGVEFDEDKMLWYGDTASRKYFLLTKDAIRNAEAFPFHQISLSQGDPDFSATVRRRHMSFDFDPFEPRYLGTSEIYCIKAKFRDLEELGYRYDKVASNMPQRPDSTGNFHLLPFRTEIYVGDVDRKSIGFKQINLRVHPNGCLVGISYFNYPAY